MSQEPKLRAETHPETAGLQASTLDETLRRTPPQNKRRKHAKRCQSAEALSPPRRSEPSPTLLLDPTGPALRETAATQQNQSARRPVGSDGPDPTRASSSDGPKAPPGPRAHDELPGLHGHRGAPGAGGASAHEAEAQAYSGQRQGEQGVACRGENQPKDPNQKPKNQVEWVQPPPKGSGKRRRNKSGWSSFWSPFGQDGESTDRNDENMFKQTDPKDT